MIHGLIAGAHLQAAIIDDMTKSRSAIFSIYWFMAAATIGGIFFMISSWQHAGIRYAGNPTAIRRSRAASQTVSLILGMACAAILFATPPAPSRVKIAAACAVGQSLMTQLTDANMAAMTGQQVATINDLDSAINTNCHGYSFSAGAFSG